MATFQDEQVQDPSNEALGDRVKRLLGSDAQSVEVMRGPTPGSLILRTWLGLPYITSEHDDAT